MSAYVEQIGGDHYARQGAENNQHWDLMEAHDISYLEATATKYVMRWDLKGKPKEDLEKGRSYLLKMLATGRGTRRTIPWTVLGVWYQELNLDVWKQAFFNLVLGDGEASSIRHAVEMINTKLLQL